MPAIPNVHFVLSNASVTPSNAIVISRGSDQSASTTTNNSFNSPLHPRPNGSRQSGPRPTF